jgi:excinuclease ABC subunit B
VGGTPTADQSGSRIQRDYQPVQPTYAQSTTVPGTRARKPSLDDMGPGTDRPEPRRDADAVSRIRKPTLDEMGSHSNRPIPARAPDIDPRTKAGAYGEQVKGPHKPTLDEMGPHAERGLPVSGKPRPVKHPPADSPPPGGEGLGVGGTTTENKKHRHGRPRKTGRPGQ